MCPNADHVLDRFHIMQLFSESMNEFRKYQLQLTTNDDEIQLLKGNNKRLLLTRPAKLSKTNHALLEELKSLNERVVEALIIRDHLIQFFESPTKRLAKLAWYGLLKMVKEADIAQFNEFFRKLKARVDQLWAYFDHRTSSAVIEALNHKIKATKWAAYGYRNLHYFRLKILQRVGFLNTQFAPLPSRQGNSA
jgi:transposase